jgi:hypothetical protein
VPGSERLRRDKRRSSIAVAELSRRDGHLDMGLAAAN